MALSEPQREIYCRRINQNQADFKEQERRYRNEILDLDEQVDRLKEQLRQLRSDLASTRMPPLPRGGGRARLAAAVLSAVALDRARERITSEIVRNEDELTRAERALKQANFHV